MACTFCNIGNKKDNKKILLFFCTNFAINFLSIHFLLNNSFQIANTNLKQILLYNDKIVTIRTKVAILVFNSNFHLRENTHYSLINPCVTYNEFR